jgi:hypothetical protein
MAENEALAALTQSMDPRSALAQGRTLQRMEVQAITAVRVQVARDLDLIEQRVLAECRWESDKLVYSWTVNNKRAKEKSLIEGPSIKLAMILARNWGNCSTEVRVVDESKTHWTFQANFYDFELGFSTSRLYRQRKPSGGKGAYSADRQEDIEYQIGQSKAVRNVTINAIPAGLTAKAMAAAKERVKAEVAADLKKAGGPKERLRRTETAFRKWSVDLAHIEKRIGKPSSDWGPDEYQQIGAIYSAITDGTTSVQAEFFDDEDASDATDDVAAAIEAPDFE